MKKALYYVIMGACMLMVSFIAGAGVGHTFLGRLGLSTGMVVIEQETLIDQVETIQGQYYHNQYVVVSAAPGRDDIDMMKTFIHELAHWHAHDDPEHFCGWYAKELKDGDS